MNRHLLSLFLEGNTKHLAEVCDITFPFIFHCTWSVSSKTTKMSYIFLIEELMQGNVYFNLGPLKGLHS